MAEAYVNLPRKLMDKIQNLQTSAPNIAARVLGAGVGAAHDRMLMEFTKSANKGHGSGYTLSKIRTQPTTNSTAEHPQMFIGAVDETAASRMKWIEGGRVRNKRSNWSYKTENGKSVAYPLGLSKARFKPGDQIQKPRQFIGKVRKYIRSKECKQLMTDRFTKIIDSL